MQTLNPIREHMHQLLENGAIVCFPTTASPAWLLGSRLSEIADSNARSSMLAAIGGSLGCPEVSLPLAETSSLPVGISIMGAPGSDEMLMGFAQTVSDAVERNH